MADQHPGAPRDPIAPSRPAATGIPAALRPRRGTLAIVGAVLLALAVAVPAGAAWPVATRDSSRSQGFHTGHRANDIAASKGARVVPIRDGKVVFAGWKSNCGGWQVWVSHGGGLYSAYYHLSREAAYSGKPVERQRTTLGYVGTSGCVTGPHLHVEVWRGYPWRSSSYRVNPWTFIDSGSYLPSRYR